jgi:hypothetical protein
MTVMQLGANYHYVIVEVVAEQGNAASIERGLFKGLNTISAGTFLWLKPSEDIKDKVSKSCNLLYYSILSIETYDGTTRCYTFYRKDRAEQVKARETITGIYDVLKETILLKGEDYMLDVSKYHDVPDLTTGSRDIVGKKPGSMSNYYNSCHKPTTSSYTPTVYQNVDPEPTAFKRRSKKPTEDVLASLNEKLDLIAKGEYDTNFPVVKGEKIMKWIITEHRSLNSRRPLWN